MSEILDKWKARAAAAEANRASFPFAGQVVGELREEGFTKVRVVHASQDGRSIGAPSPEGVTPALSRRTDPQTSKAAAERATEFKGKHAAAIFAWLCDHPEGCTYREIAHGTGLEPVAVGRRLKELQETAGVYADGERDGMQAWKVRRG